MQSAVQRVWTADDDKEWHIQQDLCPLCVRERKNKEIVKSHASPCTWKTCLKDRNFLWVSTYNGFFKVISLWAAGFAALLKFLWVQSAEEIDVYSTPNSNTALAFP